MATLKQSFGSGFFNASDVAEKPITLKIAAIGDGEKFNPRVLSFYNEEKQLGLNLTRWNECAEACGLDPEKCDDADFVGKTIELFHDWTMFDGKRVGCVRIRKPNTP